MALLAWVVLAALIAACGSSEEGPSAPAIQPAKPLYDVTYVGNGNTAGADPIDPAKYEYGSGLVTALHRGDLYRVGYRFTGWNTQADGGGDSLKEGAEFRMKNSRVHLYAQWEEVFPRVNAGEHFSTLITKDGKVYAAGRNTSGRLGDGTTTTRQTFVEIKTSGPIKSVSSGQDHSAAILRDGGVVVWGNGDMGKLGNGTDSTGNTSPIDPSVSGPIGVAFGKAKYISMGRAQTAILTENGDYWATGIRYNGALGNGNTGPDREKSLRFILGNVVSAAAGSNYILLIKKDGAMWIAGEGADGKLGTANTDTVINLRENFAIDHSNVVVFAGKNNHSMLLKKDGRIMAAGLNNVGQLGTGSGNPQIFFTPVISSADNKALTGVAYASLGNNHSMILKNDGTLWGMGRNYDYQLGITPPSNQFTAVKVLDHVAHVASGYDHTLAVTEDGTLWAAGSNAYGQFGRVPVRTNETSIWTPIDISNIVPATP
jgi:alpha-tubulin suppressor-like RCC1 family protein